LLTDPDFRQPGPIDLTLGVDVYPRLMTGELLRLAPKKPLAQRTRLGYEDTCFFNKEISSDTEITPILEEYVDDLA